MAFLAAVPVAMLVGAGLAAGGGILKGVSEKRAAGEQAKQLEHQADVEQAGAQRSAADERRTARYVSSRAQAVAAAGGGSVSDPTVTNILADIGTEGEYRSLTALYNGDETALALRRQALAVKKAGKAAMQSAVLGAASGGLSFGSSMYEKYGGGGPGI